MTAAGSEPTSVRAAPAESSGSISSVPLQAQHQDDRPAVTVQTRGAVAPLFGASYDGAMGDLDARGMRFLYVGSGKRGLPYGVDSFVEWAGGAVDMFDIVNEPQLHDICEDIVFERIVADVKAGKYCGGFFSPAYCTFVPGRRGERGRGSLRGAAVPDIHVFTHLRPADKDRVRSGTLLALRCGILAKELQGVGAPWGYETPTPELGSPSVFGLPEIAALDDLPGVHTQSFVQCLMGARASRPTSVKGKPCGWKTPRAHARMSLRAATLRQVRRMHTRLASMLASPGPSSRAPWLRGRALMPRLFWAQPLPPHPSPRP